ncbi:MAG TPA: tyrosine-type recombinase/integrase [Cyclobacteriaceae bacterium]|nr:tyrosine-type recombinase/integrase [Cyclobacteriaceae bacterium]
MNLNQKFTVRFWLNKRKVNQQGLVPIWARITIDGKVAECSTTRKILPAQWDSVNNCVAAGLPDSKTINKHLVLVEAEITKHYNILCSTRELVAPDDVKNSFKGIKSEQKTLLQVFDQFLQHQCDKKEAGDIKQKRYDRFVILRNKCVSFMKTRFKKSDFVIEEAKLAFITEFQQYLRTVEKIGHNTAMKYAKDFKQVMRYAVTLEYVPSNKFADFKCTYKRTKREYLDTEELQRMYEKSMPVTRLEEVRDCYIFSCYTGYAYSDAAALGVEHLGKGIDGRQWIIRDRQKTETVENIPLLPIPLSIINKYKNHPYCKATNRLLPMNSNQRYNGYLKEVADICGIKKNLTTHTARHTFATTVLLTNDVPMETAMELLGHTDIRTTQIYGKIVQKKISKDMELLRKKISVHASGV